MAGRLEQVVIDYLEEAQSMLLALSLCSIPQRAPQATLLHSAEQLRPSAKAIYTASALLQRYTTIPKVMALDHVPGPLYSAVHKTVLGDWARASTQPKLAWSPLAFWATQANLYAFADIWHLLRHAPWPYAQVYTNIPLQRTEFWMGPLEEKIICAAQSRGVDDREGDAETLQHGALTEAAWRTLRVLVHSWEHHARERAIEPLVELLCGTDPSTGLGEAVKPVSLFPYERLSIDHARAELEAQGPLYIPTRRIQPLEMMERANTAARLLNLLAELALQGGLDRDLLRRCARKNMAQLAHDELESLCYAMGPKHALPFQDAIGAYVTVMQGGKDGDFLYPFSRRTTADVASLLHTLTTPFTPATRDLHALRAWFRIVFLKYYLLAQWIQLGMDCNTTTWAFLQAHIAELQQALEETQNEERTGMLASLQSMADTVWASYERR
ncbi:hypothetical protein MVES_001309 [Malassezia vespertilionis]|uniref:Uncharacterized protein n=1 Tax=Malassezia vespertilionis TaxID=2020962 RepID=A0A2N1JFE5_9BASI|nr:hypothetical protein MVES_001309 [Malassezia vespertilionis]